MASQYATPRDPQLVALGVLRGPVTAAYPSAHVGAQVPDPRPAHVVTVRSDGGPMVDQAMTEVRLGVNAWAPDEPAAFVLAGLVESTLLASPDGSLILGATSVSGPVFIAEPMTDAAHIYMTFELVIAGSTT